MNLQPLLEPGWVNAILPEIILCVGGMLLVLFDAFAPRVHRDRARPLWRARLPEALARLVSPLL